MGRGGDVDQVPARSCLFTARTQLRYSEDPVAIWNSCCTSLLSYRRLVVVEYFGTSVSAITIIRRGNDYCVDGKARCQDGKITKWTSLWAVTNPTKTGLCCRMSEKLVLGY